MPDFSESNQASDSWDTDGSANSVIHSLTEALGKWQPTVHTSTEDTVELTLGSGTSYRMFGAFTPVRKMPMRLRIAVMQVSDQASRVTVDAISNQGWYAFGIRSISASIFRRAFEKLFRTLRGVAPPSPGRMR